MASNLATSLPALDIVDATITFCTGSLVKGLDTNNTFLSASKNDIL